MSRPWLIGVAFGLCLTVALAAMAWVSVRAIRLERDERRTEQKMELEEDVRLALSRMEAQLNLIIAEENARPHYVYSAFHPLPRAFTAMFDPIEARLVQAPSQLLYYDSPFIHLHFQVGPDHHVTSPQVPQSNMRDVAEMLVPKDNRDAAHDKITDAAKMLDRLRPLLKSGDLLARLPAAVRSRQSWSQQLSLVAPVPLMAPANAPGDQQATQQANQPQPEQQQAQQPSDRRGGKPSGRLQQIGRAEWQALKRIQDAYSNAQVQAKIPFNDLDTADVSEGVMRPFWLDNALVLARRVTVNAKDYVQGAWLNWVALQQSLTTSVADVFPNAKLVPVRGDDDRPTARMLTNIDARIDIGDAEQVAVAGVGAIPGVLIAAWVCMLLAAAAVGALLVGAVKLSERRGAFVSAVTHELRTPLTTFRMYTEMLSEKMIDDEQRRSQYLDTMRGEADRLSHLVENVLAYARLERGSPATRMQTTTVGELIHNVEDRLRQRAEQANMQVEVEPNGVADTAVRADPGAVDQVLFNLMDNACKYAADADDRVIHLEAGKDNGLVTLRVRDHGPGVRRADVRRLFKPFHKSARDAAHSAPGVGLGLALSRRLAHAMGGDLRVRECNGGACFELSLPVA